MTRKPEWFHEARTPEPKYKTKGMCLFSTASVDLTNSVAYGLTSSLRYLKTEALDHVVV